MYFDMPDGEERRATFYGIDPYRSGEQYRRHYAAIAIGLLQFIPCARVRTPTR